MNRSGSPWVESRYSPAKLPNPSCTPNQNSGFRPTSQEVDRLFPFLGAHAARRGRDESRDSIAVGLTKLAETRDNVTGMHLERVSAFALTLARGLRETERFRDEIDDRFLADRSIKRDAYESGRPSAEDACRIGDARFLPEGP